MRETIVIDTTIRDALDAAGVDQRQLARAMGIREAALSEHIRWGKPLPRGLKPSDALAVIEQIQHQ